MRLVLALCVSLLVGCQASRDASFGQMEADFEEANQNPHLDRNIGWSIALYLPNRLVDLLEVFRIGLSLGPSVIGDVRVTRFAQVAVGMHSNMGVGWVGRRRSPFRAESNSFAALGPFRAIVQKPDWPYTTWALQVEVGAAFIGVMFAFDFAELIDMLSGWFGADILHDDWGYD